MTSRRKTITILLAVSITSLLCLYAYSWTLSPRDARIGDIGQDDLGAFVKIRGHVRFVESLNSGGIRIDLLDYEDLSSISAYVPDSVLRSLDFKHEIRPGAFIELAGEVQEFNGEVEVTTTEGGMISILEKSEKNRLGLGTLAKNPGTFSGMIATVRGKAGSLASVVDWEKLLAVSGSDRIWVDVESRGGFGGRVDIFGEVHYNEVRHRHEIKVAGMNDSISPHGRQPPAGYEAVVLADLVKDPSSWEGRRVALIDVDVLAGEVIGTSLTLSDAETGEYYSISCMIFGWAWYRDGRGVENGTVVEMLGTWGYYPSKAQWQITSDLFTLQVLS